MHSPVAASCNVITRRTQYKSIESYRTNANKQVNSKKINEITLNGLVSAMLSNHAIRVIAAIDGFELFVWLIFLYKFSGNYRVFFLANTIIIAGNIIKINCKLSMNASN